MMDHFFLSNEHFYSNHELLKTNEKVECISFTDLLFFNSIQEYDVQILFILRILLTFILMQNNEFQQ